MKLLLLPLVLAAIFASPSLSADPVPQPPVLFTAGVANTYAADWNGVATRVYFMQWSVDLANWYYVPMMEFGPGSKSYGLTSTTAKFFVRLNYLDDATAVDLDDAKAADADGDGIANLFEVEVTATSPLLQDTDGDSVNDSADLASVPASASLQVFTPLE